MGGYHRQQRSVLSSCLGVLRQTVSVAANRGSAFVADTRAGLSVVHALAMVPIAITIGMAVDYSSTVRSRDALQAATDSAVLGVNTATAASNDEIKARVEKALRGQAPADLKDLTVSTTVSADGRSVTATARANVIHPVPALFVPVHSSVSATATAKRGLGLGVELALVLDTTGSMAEKNKMPTLKSAANLLVDTLTSDPSTDVKIALVPFAIYVNVGTANRGASWLTRSDNYSVSTPYSVPESCTTKKDLISQTCTTVPKVTYSDGVAINGTTQQCTNQVYGPPYQACTPARSGVSTTNYTWSGCVGSRPQPSNLTDSNPAIPYPALYNTSCGSTSVVPLSSDFAALKIKITGLTPAGETYAPAGLVWGLNVLSPGVPFNEAKPFDPDRRKPRKAMVFMTDGVNTKSMPSATATTHTGSSRADADKATSDLCTNIKAKGIEIYSVALMVDDTSAQKMLRDCASDPAHYFDATDTAALQEAFQLIAKSLQTPFLSQ